MSILASIDFCCMQFFLFYFENVITFILFGTVFTQLIVSLILFPPGVSKVEMILNEYIQCQVYPWK